MTLLVIPNVSEGRDRTRIDIFAHLVRDAGARVLDVHADPSHNRCVLTITGGPEELVEAMTVLARETKTIDMSVHEGVHPRLGGLDVCPVVPHHEAMAVAVEVAHQIGHAIGDVAALPVYFYGEAAIPPGSRELPELRRGGLSQLAARARSGFAPDEGPDQIDARTGVVCVGARGPLLAFNVWIDAGLATARRVAERVRSSHSRLRGVRALGLWMEHRSVAQVSMNLTQPELTSIDEAFEAVEVAARTLDAKVVATEIVGLIPEIYRPSPNGKAARFLIEPGRSLESALTS